MISAGSPCGRTRLLGLLSTILALLSPHVGASETGLDFPGSAAVSSTMRFKFADPQKNGLPLYGPDGEGVTYIWRAYPRRQAGYYTAFFWGNDDGKGALDTFLWTEDGDADSYYGAHPYPQPRPHGRNHKWEISIERHDYLNGDVEYDRWHVQAFRAWTGWFGNYHEFYWDLPHTDEAHRVVHRSPRSWGDREPPQPALTWGDAPWAPGNEVWNGVLRGIQIYSTKLSMEDIAQEIEKPLSTEAGARSIWYLNLDPTPEDIADKSGRGNHPVWIGDERADLWVAPR